MDTGRMWDARFRNPSPHDLAAEPPAAAQRPPSPLARRLRGSGPPLLPGTCHTATVRQDHPAAAVLTRTGRRATAVAADAAFGALAVLVAILSLRQKYNRCKSLIL